MILFLNFPFSFYAKYKTLFYCTQQVTTIGQWQVGHKVNLEIDLIARYLERLLLKQNNDDSKTPASKITLDTLSQNGYL